MYIKEVHKEIGKRIARNRIDSELTQKELADKAGVGLGTIIRLEDGKSTSTETLYRVLWALNVLENLEELLPDADFQPTDVLRWNKKAPQRARKKKN